MSNMYRISFLVSILWLLFFSGIIRHDVDVTEYEKLANKPEFDCVGMIKNDIRELQGSCVLIDKKHVLSAAHVFIKGKYVQDSTYVGSSFVKYQKQTSVEVADVNKLFFEFEGNIVKGKKITIHPVYLENRGKKECDIAIVELEREISNIKPGILYQQFNELDRNVLGVGYGAFLIADKPETKLALSKKIAGENTIDSLAGNEIDGHQTMLFADFDCLGNSSCNRIGSAVPRPLEYITSGGDSGGGLFIKTGNNLELVGITSGARVEVDRLLSTGYYGQLMVWTRVSPFYPWIKSIIEK